MFQLRHQPSWNVERRIQTVVKVRGYVPNFCFPVWERACYFFRVGFLGNQTKTCVTIAHMATVMQAMDPSMKAATVASELAHHGAALFAKARVLSSRTRFGALLASHLMFKTMHHFNAFKAQLQLVGRLKPLTALDSTSTADDIDTGIYAMYVKQHAITEVAFDNLRRTFSGHNHADVLRTLTSGQPYDGK